MTPLLAAAMCVVSGLDLFNCKGWATCCVVTLVLQVQLGMSILRLLHYATSLTCVSLCTRRDAHEKSCPESVRKLLLKIITFVPLLTCA